MDEASILIKLDHPNIVKYYETYQDDSNLYLVMEYINGCELFEHIAK
jgi:serine/threonine protein kinase